MQDALSQTDSKSQTTTQFSPSTSSSNTSSIVMLNQIERKVHHKIIKEKVPVIFAFAIMGDKKDLYDEQLLPPNISEKDSNINWVSPIDGATPLHLASMYGKTLFVQQLLKVGSELDAKTKDGNTPLQSAVKAGRTKVCVHLIRKSNISLLNSVNSNGESALFISVMKKNSALVISLLKHGANVDIANENGVTPLMLSLLLNDNVIIKYLLEYNADTTLVDNKGRNCLHFYAQTENYNINTVEHVREIAKNKKLIFSTDDDGKKPIHYALCVGIEDIVNHFLALSSLKDVGIVYSEMESICTSSQRKRTLTGKDRVTCVMKTDSLGYEIEDNNKPKEVDKYIESSQRQEKWVKMINHYKKHHKLHKKLILRLYKGVPSNQRPLLWKEFLEISSNITKYPQLYSDLNKKENDGEEDDQIHKDVTRAHQNNIKFMCKYSEGQKKLFLALRAYAIKDKEIGYVQGMADLYGFFILVFNDEQDAFWGIYSTINSPQYQLRDKFLRDFPGVKQCMNLELMMLKKYHKDIYRHIIKLGGFEFIQIHMLEFYLLWFSRIFSGDLSIWLLDIIIVEGWQLTLSITSTIYYFLHTQILNQEDKCEKFDKYSFIKQLKKLRVPPLQVDKWISKNNSS
ncbi:Rab GTPase activating protein [Entamoeba marina]